jgi:nucleotide-binding universal stress UspA family protein
MAESITTIVVPLDESTLSESALPVADELAAALGASVLCLTAGWGSTTEELGDYLNARAAALRAPHSTAVTPDTFPATAIAEAAGDGSMVVMATHGRSGVGKALLGSVAEDLLKRSDRPVVLLGPRVRSGTPVVGGVMGVTTDGSPTSAMILPRVSHLASSLGMTVRVLSVHAGGGSPLGGAEREAVDRAMESAVAFLTAEGVTATAEPLMGADAAEVVARWAADNDAALLAMSTHGRSGVARTALGSVTVKTVHDAPCPVLVQRSAG